MFYPFFMSSQPILVGIALIQLFPATSSIQPTWSCHEKTGSCYYLSDFISRVGDALCWCRSAGGQMVKIDSLEELELIRRLMRNTTQTDGFYVGARDRRTEGRFVWEDGTFAGDVLPWRSGEQDNDGGEHCVFLSDRIWWNMPPDPLADYLAFDIPCDDEHHFICETGQLRSRTWEMRSRDETYPTETYQYFSGLLTLECADRCARTCVCSSFAHRSGQDGGDCIVYHKPYSRLSGPQMSPGYVIYD